MATTTCVPAALPVLPAALDRPARTAVAAFAARVARAGGELDLLAAELGLRPYAMAGYEAAGRGADAPVALWLQYRTGRGGEFFRLQASVCATAPACPAAQLAAVASQAARMKNFAERAGAILAAELRPGGYMSWCATLVLAALRDRGLAAQIARAFEGHNEAFYGELEQFYRDMAPAP